MAYLLFILLLYVLENTVPVCLSPCVSSACGYTASKQLLLCGLWLGLVRGPHFAVAGSPDLPDPQASRKASRNVCRLDSLPPPQPECQHYRVLEAERPGPKAQSLLRPVWSRPAALGWELECPRTTRCLLPVLSRNLDVKTPLKTHGYFPPMSCPPRRVLPHCKHYIEQS